MAYENLCMYCFEDLGGESVCPHCGRDNRAAVPQIQMLPGTLVYHDRFLVGRALGQDASGIVYAAFDTKRENKLRLREYLPRDCAERLNDGAVVPMPGMEDAFEKGLKRLRASVESVEDPRKRHFFFEENGTAYIAQRRSASAGGHHAEEEEEERRGMKLGWIIGIAAAVVLVAAVVIIMLINGALGGRNDVTQNPTIAPNDDVWSPAETPTPTPYVSPTFAALVDPEQSWMDYTYSGNVDKEFQQQQDGVKATAKPTVRPDTPNYSAVGTKSDKEDVTNLQQRLNKLGWLSSKNVTGKYDSATKEAVKAFQTYINENVRPAEKLAVDGIAGPKTMMWLYGTDQTRPTPSPTPLVTADPADKLTVDKNSSKNDIRSVQRKLIVLGLMKSGADDGVYGTTTTAAVKQFQQRVNEIEGFSVLEITGTVNPQTMAYLNHYVAWWEALQSATATPAPTSTPTPTAKPTDTPAPTPTQIPDAPEDGDKVDSSSPKESIQAVQQMLIQVGLMDTGSDDGIYGSATVAAVARFQEWFNQQAGKNELSVSGIADARTLNYLEYMAANGMTARTPAPTEVPTPTPVPTQSPTEIPDEPEDNTVVGPGSEKESIQAVQEMLVQLGLLSDGSADGVYGKGTEAAVRAFQEFVNRREGGAMLEVTGLCNASTLGYMEDYADAGIQAGATPEPTQAAAGEVRLTINGTTPGDGPVSVSGDSVSFQWGATGSVESYYLYIVKPDGGDLYNYEAIEYTEGRISTADLVPGEIYTIRIGALPAGGGEDDIVWVSAQFGVPSQDATAAPEPTQAPQTSVRMSVNGSEAAGGVIEVSGEKVTFDWSAENAQSAFAVKITGDDGSTVLDDSNYKSTHGELPVSQLRPGVTYTFSVGARPEGDGEIVWSSVQFTVPMTTEAPTEAPTEVPTPRPASKPQLTVNGSAAGDGTLEITGDSVSFDWESDASAFAVRITGDDGSTILDDSNYRSTHGQIPVSQLKPGVTYTFEVGALSDGAETVWTSVTFTVPVQPTEAPTPEPTVAAISAPTINIDGSAREQDGVAYLTGSKAIISWTSGGAVERYRVRIENQSGESRDVSDGADTSFTFDPTGWPAGLYRIIVEAVPAGARSESDIQTSTFVFGIPSAEPTEAPTPEPAPTQPANWPTTLDKNSAATDIQNVQMKLYQLGLLVTDGLQPGTLDEMTLQAIASFQQRMNEQYDLNLPGIDPTNPDAIIDTQTLQAIQQATPDMFAE